jgi:hypothetical protein
VENRELLFSYLLGDLSPDERKRMQENAAANQVLREAIQEAESDLIDSYVSQRLSETQSSRFETYFLDSNEKRQSVEMAQILLSPAVRRMASVLEFSELAGAAPARIRMQPRWWNWVAFARLGALATLLLAIATVVVAVQNLRLRSQLQRISSGEVNSRKQIAELKNQIFELQKPDEVTLDYGGFEPKREISLVLSPGQQRSGEDAPVPALLKLPPLPRAVLTLELEQDRYPQYDVSVKTVEGKETWSKRHLKSQPGLLGPRVLVLHLPSDLLAPGDYLIRVSARTSSGEQRSVEAYAFTVTR